MEQAFQADKNVYLLPKELGEIALSCTRCKGQCTQDQADYKGVKVEHPFHAYKNDVLFLPNELDSKVPKLHFLALNSAPPAHKLLASMSSSAQGLRQCGMTPPGAI